MNTDFLFYFKPVMESYMYKSTSRFFSMGLDCDFNFTESLISERWFNLYTVVDGEEALIGTVIGYVLNTDNFFKESVDFDSFCNKHIKPYMLPEILSDTLEALSSNHLLRVLAPHIYLVEMILLDGEYRDAVFLEFVARQLNYVFLDIYDIDNISICIPEYSKELLEKYDRDICYTELTEAYSSMDKSKDIIRLSCGMDFLVIVKKE